VTPPKIPTIAELTRVENASEGAAARVLDVYFTAAKKHEERLDRELEAKLAYQQHVQRYRYVSVACGSFLALASLGVCALGVWQKVDIVPLAWVLGPVTGLAGVFVWGYRPRSEQKEIGQPQRKVRTQTDS
jgi:hypothetical protein